MTNYRKPNKLLQLYVWMKAYFEKNQRHATNREIVEAGFSKTTSHVRYMFAAMVEYNMMAEQERGVARGVYLLPLTEAAPEIRELAGV